MKVLKTYCRFLTVDRVLIIIIFLLSMALSLTLLWDYLPLWAGMQHEMFFDGGNDKISMEYLLFLPKDYYKVAHAWPLLLFLHGSGGRGTSLEGLKKHGPPKIVETEKNFPFILVSPRCPMDCTWEPESLKALLDEVVAKYNVDPDRISVTGMSMGGFGTWALAATYSDRFAAIVPICGGGDPNSADRLKNMAIWVFHGAKDKSVPLQESQKMVDALKDLGSNVRFTVYPAAGHDCWTETYANRELYKWLLEQKRVLKKDDVAVMILHKTSIADNGKY
jgi:predicted peptidase